MHKTGTTTITRQKLKFKIPEVYFIVATLSAEIKKIKKKSIFHTKQKHISQELSLNGWVSGLVLEGGGGFPLLLLASTYICPPDL